MADRCVILIVAALLLVLAIVVFITALGGLPVPAHVGILMNLTPCVGNSGRQRARPPCCVRQELAAGVIFQTTLP
jgi:hypothetical protein